MFQNMYSNGSKLPNHHLLKWKIIGTHKTANISVNDYQNKNDNELLLLILLWVGIVVVVVGQLWLLQVWVSVSASVPFSVLESKNRSFVAHIDPPISGSGLSHILILYWDPPPQVEEQSFQSPQAPHAPSTRTLTRTKIIYKHFHSDIRPKTSYLFNDNLSIPDSAVVVGGTVVVPSVKKVSC